MCDASFSAISLVCKDRQWFKSEVGLGIGQTPISQSVCAHAIQQPRILVVADTQTDRLFANQALVTDYPLMRFYAGMPIVASDGTPIATLCVLEPAARPEGLIKVPQLTLRVLAKQVEAQPELRRSIIMRDRRAIQQQSAATTLRWIATHDSFRKLSLVCAGSMQTEPYFEI